MSDCILSIREFSKHFRSHWTFRPTTAISNLSLDVIRGESFGFIGHNGAGKTTTIKTILGLLKANAGEFIFEGEKLCRAEQRKGIGYLPEQPYFYDHLSIYESLDFFASLGGLKGSSKTKRIDELLERLGLNQRANNKVGTLSKGLQQRLGIAGAIVNNPKLLFLDEPFSGLDPVGRREIRELIVELNKNGTTIFLSSHILSDVQDMCDRVGILAHGQLRALFALKDLPELYGQGYELVIKDSPSSQGFCQRVAGQAALVNSHKALDDVLTTLRFSDYQTATEALSAAISSSVQIQLFQPANLRLEDVFVKIVEEEHGAQNQ
jgi:ABC-2 type transport system ATP-binding protein